MQLATIYLSNGDEDQAEQVFEAMIAEAPKFAPAYASLGTINEKRGDKGKALELYGTALKYDPGNVLALNNSAYLLIDNFGKEKEALDLAMRAFRNQPNDPRIMDTLGYVLVKNKQGKSALNLLVKAEEMLPNMSTIKLHLAMAKIETGDKSAGKELLNQVLTTGSENEKAEAKELLKSL